MDKMTFRKNHKWVGLVFAFFMLMFCLSGIILNHRSWVAHVNVGRQWLPQSFRYKDLNGGLLRGTMPLKGECFDADVLAYGNSGVWLVDDATHAFKDFNQGLPQGADFRNIKGCVQTPDQTLWALGQFGLYGWQSPQDGWRERNLPSVPGERFTDLTLKGDTLVVLGRSHVYVSASPYTAFERRQLAAPEGYDGKVSLFRTVWNLHSGEMFGIVGKLLMDAVAVVLIVLCLTGVAHWLFPKYIKRRKKAGANVALSAKAMKQNLNWHDKLGRYTFGILIFVSLTGWCLRPPVLIALVKGHVPAIPYTVMDSDNPWRDRLRMIRYDAQQEDWLLSTSEGLYTLDSLEATPVRVEKAPPISVMGLNAFQKDADGNWLMGSFSGMFRWNRETGVATDYFTGEVTQEVSGPPFGKFAVSGYSDDLGKPFVVEYYQGTDALAMPQEMSHLPMSLWNLALEVHTGRIYTVLGPGTLIYIFFAGLAALWCIYTGYRIRKPKHKK